MKPTHTNFTIIVYAVPFGTGIFIFFFLILVNKRVNWFILRTILGVKWEPKSEDKGNAESSSTQNRAEVVGAEEQRGNSLEGQQKSNTTYIEPIEEYLYIDFNGDDSSKSIPAIPWIIRLLSDVLAAAILGMFTAIISQSLIMTNVLVSNGEKYSDSDAYCFRSNPSTGTDTFNCTKNKCINSTVWTEQHGDVWVGHIKMKTSMMYSVHLVAYLALCHPLCRLSMICPSARNTAI